MDVVRYLAFAFMLLVLSIGYAAAPCHGAELVWDSETGWSAEGEGQPSKVESLYKHGRELFVKGEALAAMDVFVAIERKYPASPYLLQAKLAQAKCLGYLARFEQAVRVCEESVPLADTDTPVSEILQLEIALLETMSLDRPQRAREMLSKLAESAPDAESRKAAKDALARIPQASLPSRPDRAKSVVEDGTYEGFYLGREILQSCREGMHDDASLRAAQGHFREFLKTNPQTKRDVARAYLRAIEGILDATDLEHQSVYYAMTYIPEGRYSEARRTLKRIAKRFPETEVGELATFQYAESLYLEGRFWKAFHAYESLIDSYPKTDSLPTLSGRELAIAESLLDHDEAKKAITVLEILIKRDPLGLLVDDAQMYMGRAYMELENYATAKEVFSGIPQDFPRSEWSKAAVFLAGKADFLNAESATDRAELLANAREAFELYLWQSPEGTFSDEAKTLLQKSIEGQAAGLWEIARFYEKSGEYQSAAWYYGLLKRDYPDSSHAELAEAAVNEYREVGFRMP